MEKSAVWCLGNVGAFDDGPVICVPINALDSLWNAEIVED